MLCDGLRIDFNQCQWEPLTIYVIMNIEKYRHILSHHFQYENDVKHTGQSIKNNNNNKTNHRLEHRPRQCEIILMEKKSFECPDWRTIPEDDLTTRRLG